MPTWLQIVLPIVTLFVGAGLGFFAIALVVIAAQSEDRY